MIGLFSRAFKHHDMLTYVFAVIALALVAFGLDQIPRGSAYAVTAENCTVATQINGEAKCTGLRQDYGFPFARGSKLTELKPADGETNFVPKSAYICQSGCNQNGSRHNFSHNFILVFGLATAYMLVKNFVIDRWIDRKLVKQWEDDNKRNPVKPGKGW